MTDLFNFSGSITHDVDQFTSLWVVIGALWLLCIIVGFLIASFFASLFEVVYEDGTTNTEPIINGTLKVFMGLGIPASVIGGMYLFSTYDLHQYLTLI